MDSGPNFLSRMEKRIDGSNRLIVTLAHDISNPAEPFGSIIFDIDRIVEKQMMAETHTIDEELELLHEDIWNVFESSKNEKLEGLLTREN